MSVLLDIDTPRDFERLLARVIDAKRALPDAERQEELERDVLMLQVGLAKLVDLTHRLETKVTKGLEP